MTRRTRLTFSGVLAIVVTATLAIMAGIWLGRIATPSEPPPPAPHLVSVGPARVLVPGDWNAGSLRRTGVADLTAGGAVAFETTPGLGEWAVMLFSRTFEPSLIPSELRRELRSPVPAPARTRLAGSPAWTYRGLATATPRLRVDVTVLPTTAGVLAVACTSRVPLVVDEAPCAADVESLIVPGASPLTPTPSLALQETLPAVLDDLNRERLEDRADLRNAHTQAAQALAAGHLALDHRASARAIDAAAGKAGAPLARDLTAVANAYDSLQEQAEAGSATGFAAARADVEDAETVLAASVRDVRRPAVASVWRTIPAQAPETSSDPAPRVPWPVFALLIALAIAAGAVTGSSDLASRAWRHPDLGARLASMRAWSGRR
jgi:hypothetical protein